MKEVNKFIIDHMDGSVTYFHPEMHGKPKNTIGYEKVGEHEFSHMMCSNSSLPLNGSLEVASWGGVSVCLKITSNNEKYAVVARLLPGEYNRKQISYLDKLEQQTRDFFSGFSIPQIKVISNSNFGSPMLLKISKWIEREDLSLVDILNSPENSSQVRDLSKRVLEYFFQTGRLIDLSGNIKGGRFEKYIPFTVINSENIFFDKNTNQLKLVDSGLWPANHCFNEANLKQKTIILSRLGLTALLYSITSLSTRMSQAFENR